MSVSICLEEISFLEKTCRACSRYDPNDSMTFRPIFNDGNSGKPSVEVAGVFEEFLLWNLEIKENDGLPQQMCNDCLERFIQVKLFREEVLDSQRLLSSYLKGDTNDPKHGGATITIETLPMSSDNGDRIGYVSPSKLIEYVGSEEENEENPTLNKSETDYFEENESDYLFNHPNQIETNTLMDFKADKPESIEFKPSCTKVFEEKSVEQPNEVKETQSDGGSTKCELCLKSFRTTHHLMRHKRMFHIRVDLNCPICGRKFEKITQRNFDYHLRSHHAKKYKCAYCEKSFQQKVHLINHERTHTGEKPFGCNVCGKKFRQQSSLQEHLMTHKDPHPFKCEICGKGFTQRSGLRLHVRLHNSVKQYQCEFCGEGFHQKAHLDLHVMNHTGERPFQCEFCSKSFRQGYQLGNHIHTAHFQNSDSIRNGEYQCSQCDREFTNAMDLIQHKKSHDNGERKFLCPQCGAGFKKETHLNLHVDAVHLKKKPYNCNYCNKTFAQLSNLNEHLKIHKGSKQHKCNICDKSFTLRKTLLMHEAIHTGEKRFKCNFCDESFVYRQTLGAHIMNHFRDENEEEYSINEEVLGDEDFLDYNEDLELNDEFQLIDQYVQIDN